MRKLNWRQQDCYLVCINDFDDGTIFHIVKKNLRIDQPAEIPFESELGMNNTTDLPMQEVVPIGAGNTARDRESRTNEVQNFHGNLSREYTREKIDELRQQDIVVDDNNEHVPENDNPPEQGEPPGGTWEKPTTCPC